MKLQTSNQNTCKRNHRVEEQSLMLVLKSNYCLMVSGLRVFIHALGSFYKNRHDMLEMQEQKWSKDRYIKQSISLWIARGSFWRD